MPGAASDLMVDILNIWPGGRIAEGAHRAPLSTQSVQDETFDHLGDPSSSLRPWCAVPAPDLVGGVARGDPESGVGDHVVIVARIPTAITWEASSPGCSGQAATPVPVAAFVHELEEVGGALHHGIARGVRRAAGRWHGRTGALGQSSSPS